MSKIILTEKQLERIITLSLKEEISGRKSVKEQNLLNIPTSNKKVYLENSSTIIESDSNSEGKNIHNLLLNKGLINSFTSMSGDENRRLVYKGAPLLQEQVTQLTNYFVSNGYSEYSQQMEDKRYGQKYVWVKGDGVPSDTDMAV